MIQESEKAKEGAIGYGVDKEIGTNNHVFSIIGPNGNGSGYGDISIVLKQDIMKHPDFNMTPTAGTSFVSDEMYKHREWAKESRKKEYDKALGQYEKSLKIREKIGDELGIGACLNNIALVHYGKEDYESALKYLEKSLEISKKLGDQESSASTLNNIGAIYQNKGDFAKAKSAEKKKQKKRRQRKVFFFIHKPPSRKMRLYPSGKLLLQQHCHKRKLD